LDCVPAIVFQSIVCRFQKRHRQNGWQLGDIQWGERVQAWVLCSPLAKDFNDWLVLHASEDTDSDSVGSGAIPESLKPCENHDSDDATIAEDNELGDTHAAAPDSDDHGVRRWGPLAGAWWQDDHKDAEQWKSHSSHTWWDASPDRWWDAPLH
jgi:hypothetical protein